MTSPAEILTGLGLPKPPSSNAEFIGGALWAREQMQAHLDTVYRANGPDAIDSLGAININGCQQWLQVRGRNKDNPILLYLHGGPGAPMIGWIDETTRPWEDYFTVVHWDQRQTGKSYYPADDKEQPLSIGQFIRDAEDVVRYLLKTYKKQKLFLLGHSWGSVIGMHLVKHIPELIFAYIGVGQVVNWMDNEKVFFNHLLQRAKEEDDQSLVKHLDKIAPYPPETSPQREEAFSKHTAFLRQALCDLSGEAMMHHTSFDNIVKMINFKQLISPYLSLTDIVNSVVGDEIALLRKPYTLTEEYMSIDLPNDLGMRFEVPIFLFTGTHDWHTPKVLSDKWLENIDAPSKERVEFFDSSHYLVNEEPGKVLVNLVNKVLPCAS